MTDRELLQQALDALKNAETDGNCEYGVTEALRARLAQPEPKPVAWRKKWEGENEWTYYWCERYKDSEPLYTAPPQREWVGLTDEEVDCAYEAGHKSRSGLWSVTKYTEAIEAKLREKNYV